MHVSVCCTVEAAAVYVSREDKHVNIDHLQVEPIADGQMMATSMGSSFIFIFSQAPSGLSSVSIVIARVLIRSCSSSRTFKISVGKQPRYLAAPKIRFAPTTAGTPAVIWVTAQ